MIATKQIKSISEKCIPPNNYKAINVFSWHEKDTEYYDLCPYYLKTDGNEIQLNDGNVIFENFWQGSKVYPKVYPIEIYPHVSLKGNPKYLSWKYENEETHIDKNNNVLPNYWTWRQSIFDCKKPLRYPNSYKLRTTCKFAILKDKNNNLVKYDYLTARKELYCKEYMRLIRHKKSYAKLLNLLKKGENICIFEVDVPTSSKKGLYGKYAIGNVFYADLNKINDLLNDTSEPFGHGLCLAKALLEDMEIYKKNKLNDSDTDYDDSESSYEAKKPEKLIKKHVKN